MDQNNGRNQKGMARDRQQYDAQRDRQRADRDAASHHEKASFHHETAGFHHGQAARHFQSGNAGVAGHHADAAERHGQMAWRHGSYARDVIGRDDEARWGDEGGQNADYRSGERGQRYDRENERRSTGSGQGERQGRGMGGRDIGPDIGELDRENGFDADRRNQYGGGQWSSSGEVEPGMENRGLDRDFERSRQVSDENRGADWRGNRGNRRGNQMGNRESEMRDYHARDTESRDYQSREYDRERGGPNAEQQPDEPGKEQRPMQGQSGPQQGQPGAQNGQGGAMRPSKPEHRS